MLADVFRVIGEENEPPFAGVVSYFVAAAPCLFFRNGFLRDQFNKFFVGMAAEGDTSSVNVAASKFSGTACKNLLIYGKKRSGKMTDSWGSP